MQRPTTLPGRLPGGITGNRPGIGGDRPGIGGNRPGIGGNRPGIGNDNNLWNSGNIGSGNIGIGNWGSNNNIVVGGGGWGYPGYGGGWGGGYGGWGGGYGGYVNPHYGGWYNGNWGGGYGWGGGWWAPFALGAATWGLASSIGSWGYGGAYVNPYYSSMPAAVVASSPYDYSQPVVVNNYVTTTDGDVAASAETPAAPAPATTEADRLFDGALGKFKAGDYAAALAGCDKALKSAPGDAVVHEVRALSLFALGRYPEAAAGLNAVLASAPGMDWTTMSGLYGDGDDYTKQLRALEEFCRKNTDNAAGHFVLAYHYLVGGHRDLAVEALKVVVAKQPNDAVAKRLLEALAPPSTDAAPQRGTSTAPAAAASETDLVGTWKATSGSDSVTLTITDDSGFTWEAKPTGRPAVKLAGTIETAADAIALTSETSGVMTGRVVSKGPDAFEFALAGAPPSAKPLDFTRQR